VVRPPLPVAAQEFEAVSDQPDMPEVDVDIPSPRGLLVTGERPFRVLVVADFAGGENGSLSGPLLHGVVDLAADGFDAALSEARPTIKLRTTDPTVPGNVLAELTLTCDSLRAFEPPALLRQLPAIRVMMDVREALTDRLAGTSAQPAFQQRIREFIQSDAALAWLKDALTPPAPAQAPPAGAVDDVLSQLDLDGTPPPTSAPKSPVSAAVSAAAGGGGLSAPETAALRKAMTELDRRVGLWLTTVLHDPTLQATETTWRSLRLLAASVDYRAGVRLSILHAPRSDLVDRLVSRLIDPVFDAGLPAPDLIVVGSGFSGSSSDLEQLDELTRHAASLPAVLLAGAAPAFLGAKFPWQIATLPELNNVMDQWQFAKYKSLRGRPEARALGLVFGRALLREPFAPRDSKPAEFTYHEPCLAEKDLIWVEGSVVAACVIARSVAGTGWPTMFTGYVNGRLEGFYSVKGGRAGEKTFGPTDTTLQLPKIQELARVGLNAVVGPPEQGEVIFWNGLTPMHPARADTAGVLEVSLAYQLFAVRLSSLLLELKPHLLGRPPESVVRTVGDHVRSWIPFGGEPGADRLSVRTRPNEEDPKVLELAVTVTPPESILPGGIPVVLGFRLQ
jgi:type VI secretion system ImpB/VipA family protein